MAISFKLRGISLEPLLQAKPLMKVAPAPAMPAPKFKAERGIFRAVKATKKALRAALAQECGQGIGTEHVS